MLVGNKCELRENETNGANKSVHFLEAKVWHCTFCQVHIMSVAIYVSVSSFSPLRLKRNEPNSYPDVLKMFCHYWMLDEHGYSTPCSESLVMCSIDLIALKL